MKKLITPQQHLLIPLVFCIKTVKAEAWIPTYWRLRKMQHSAGWSWSSSLCFLPKTGFPGMLSSKTRALQLALILREGSARTILPCFKLVPARNLLMRSWHLCSGNYVLYLVCFLFGKSRLWILGCVVHFCSRCVAPYLSHDAHSNLTGNLVFQVVVLRLHRRVTFYAGFWDKWSLKWEQISSASSYP